MAYSDPTATLQLFPGLPQTTTSTGYSETVVLVTNHQARADAFVDSFLARRYTTPLGATSASAPPLVKQLSQDVCAYYTYRSLFMKDNINKSDWVEDLWAEAKKTLIAIRDGEQDITGSTGAVVVEIHADTKVDANFETWAPIFNMDEPTSQSVDSDRLQDISDQRA